MTVRDIPEAYALTVSAMNSRVRQSTYGSAGNRMRGAEILGRVGNCHVISHNMPRGAKAVKGRSVSTSNYSPKTEDGAQ